MRSEGPGGCSLFFEDKGWQILALPLKTSELSAGVADTVRGKDEHSVGGQPRRSAQLGPQLPSRSWRLVSTLFASQNPVDYENRHPCLKSRQLSSLSPESYPSICLVFWNSWVVQPRGTHFSSPLEHRPTYLLTGEV